MKNISKATKMQLAKNPAVKAQINDVQTKKVSTELEQVGKRLKHSLRNRRRRARAAKEVSCYVGMDLGDKKSNYCFIDAKGNIFAEGALSTTQAELTELFSSIPKCRIAIEVGTHSPWICTLLKNHGHEGIVANPRKVEAIHKNKRKNDKIDARTLALLVRVDPELLYPIQHRGNCAILSIVRRNGGINFSGYATIGPVSSFGPQA